jgi:hypothetical protein
MKKLLILSLLSITLLNVGCKKKSTTSYETSSSSSEMKCPNCGSTSGSHPHETLPDLKICNTCGVGYY